MNSSVLNMGKSAYNTTPVSFPLSNLWLCAIKHHVAATEVKGKEGADAQGRGLIGGHSKKGHSLKTFY